MLSPQYRTHYLNTRSVFPSTFALKFFLGRNPGHDSSQLGDLSGKRILDIGFGDGRDLVLYASLGLEVFGVEIDESVVAHTREKFAGIVPSQNLRVGRNDETGFVGEHFDYVTAFSSLFYLANEQTEIEAVLGHVRTLLRPPSIRSESGWLFCTLAMEGTHVLSEATKVAPNTYILKDPYFGYRNGQRYFVFTSEEEVRSRFAESGLEVQGIFPYDANWFGSREKLSIVKARAI